MFFTWGPPHSSFDTFPIEYTVTMSGYFSINIHSAPDFTASSFDISSTVTGRASLIHSFTKSSAFCFSSSVNLWSQLKSNLILSVVMFEPLWCVSGPNTTFSAAFNRCVAVWYFVSISLSPASPPLNFCAEPSLDFSWCALNSSLNSCMSTFIPFSFASSLVTSGGKPYVSYSLNTTAPSIFSLFSCFALLIAFWNSFSPCDKVFTNLSFSSIITFFIVSAFFSSSGYISFRFSTLISTNVDISSRLICSLFICLTILRINLLKI